ncbi:FlgN protein [Anatilimnocola aggregata]|uniref:FlgN protein n=1 Tax=Anatilimnocola aggregata TaxID=2528021 RepID=A0A517YKT8_9BACT|nr:flagellar export chaperone FlgN [Anatilimnocola aggregata]QDU30847.1 FlgN protein [Anatilimnocola aggregata]
MTTALATSPVAVNAVVPPVQIAPQVAPQTATKVDWEAEISQLLAELSGVQAELLAVLGEKRQRLAAVEIGSMSELQVREQALCDRLQACHTRREELLAAAKQQGLPADSMTSLAKAAVGTTSTSQRDKLRKDLANSASRMRLLQAQSLTNWVVAQRSLLHVSQLLEIIATGGRLQPTYGVGEGVHNRGGMVDHEA